MGTNNENQKEVTEKYRTNWDQIFKSAKKQQDQQQQEQELTNKQD